MRRTPAFHEFHLVVNLQDLSRNKGEIWATKYKGYTNTKPSKLVYWQINSALEIIGKQKSVSWANGGEMHQSKQLQKALGPNYKVLEQYETQQAVTNFVNDEK